MQISLSAKVPIHPDELSGFDVLSALDRSSEQQARERACRVRLRRGESLFGQGDPARRIWLCRSGQLKLFRVSPTGQEKIMALINPGRSFAEATLFLPEPRYPVHCSALIASEVIGLDADHLVAVLENDTAACFRLLATLSRRMQQKINQIDSLSLQNAQLRIAAYLLDQYRAHGQASSFNLGAGKRHIAGFLAVQPETFSRALAQLQDQGVITCRARQVSVLDPERLESMVRSGMT